MLSSQALLAIANSTRFLLPGQTGKLIMLILDRSGSMGRFGEAPLQAVNECIMTIKNLPGANTTLAGVWTFADMVTESIPWQPLPEIPMLNEYQAQGNTALYDAVGDALHMGLEFQEFAQKKYQIRIEVGISVISDGLDVCSRTSRNRVCTFAQHARKAKFKLQSIGIGIDHRELANLLGFETGHSYTVDPTPDGVHRATRHTTQLFSDLINKH